MIKNVETCLYSNVSTFQRQATFQSGPKMWKRDYIDMFPHFEKYATVLQISSIDSGSNHGMSIILHNKVGPS